MISYLVTSRTRRELLRLLWTEQGEGSVSELARRAGIRYAAVHRELGRMQAAGLAVSRRGGNRLFFRASPESPHGAVLRALLGAPAPGDRNPDDRIRAALAEAGAPLLVEAGPGSGPRVEDALTAGLALSHRDAAVARALPVLLWRQRERLDLARLAREAARCGEANALGFFVELTGRLGGDRRLLSFARGLRPRRPPRVRPFFGPPAGPYAVAAARRRTPALARRWGYLMNMDLDSFRSNFDKHRRSP